MHKFFVDQKVSEDRITLSGYEQRHLKEVLRLKAGEKVQVTDRDGEAFICEILENRKEETSLAVLGPAEKETENRNVSITLIQGIPKGAKQELILQKGTELGIDAYLPFFASRSVVKPSKNDRKKAERLRRIAHEAAKQSGRRKIPEVFDFQSFTEMVSGLEQYDAVLLAYENEEDRRLKAVLRELPQKEDRLSLAVLIGPEGGFDAQEIEELKEKGAELFTFGERILRTETAGLAAVAQINYEYDEG